MTPHYADDSVALYAGDCIEVMRSLPDASVDAVVTDPPYGLEFMGKEWDAPWKAATGIDERDDQPWSQGTSPFNTKPRFAARNSSEGAQAGVAENSRAFQSWCTEWATEALRVLKPGGHLLAFGGTRTWHRLACAIEDAGFEVRDSICWLFGSGFPKSHNLTGDWQGWGTALKPAFEPIVVARKPLIGTVAANVLAHGTGALNVDGCRIAGEPVQSQAANSTGSFTTPGPEGPRPREYTTAGRWPANVILDESQAEALDRQSGERPGMSVRTLRRGATTGQSIGGESAYGTAAPQEAQAGYGDTGGASRFFYTAKADATERPRVDGVAHPTVKPLDLMRYLVRLVTPPGGVVLEPFAGSGTTAEACIVEGFRCIAIEREADYLPLILQRITKPIEVTLL
jgi:site-specific DNA-methyltransferase (adenine-specific)